MSGRNFQLLNNVIWRKEAGVFALLHPDSKKLKIYKPEVSQAVSGSGLIIEHEHTRGLLRELASLDAIEPAEETSSESPGPAHFTAPFNVTIQLTGRCNLSCAHCHRELTQASDLSLGHFDSLVRQLREMRVFNINISGGEPMLLEDIVERVRLVNRYGLKTTMSTNNTLLTLPLAEALRMAGLREVHISLDSRYRNEHDRMRGCNGAFQSMFERLQLLRQAKIDYTFVTTLVRQTPEDYEGIIDLAHALGAQAHKTNTLIPQGKGEKLFQEKAGSSRAAITPFIEIWKRKRAEYEGRMKVIAETMYQIQISGSEIGSGTPLPALNIGCPAGILTCGVKENGDVIPCPFFPGTVAGNFLETSFQELWEHSPVLISLRNREALHTCNNCEFLSRCGGCRARSFGIHGTLEQDDPFCFLKREELSHEAEF